MHDFHEFDDVVLRVDLPDAPLLNGERGLRVGDEGTLVDLAPDGTGGLVEFFRHGESVAVVGVRFEHLTQAPVPAAAHGDD